MLIVLFKDNKIFILGGGVFKKQLLVKFPFNNNNGLSFLIGASPKYGKMSPCKLHPSPEYNTEN